MEYVYRFLLRIRWKKAARIIRLLGILQIAEAYRIRKEKEEKDRIRKAKRKEQAGWIPWVTDTEVSEKDEEKEAIPIPIRLTQKLFDSLGTAAVIGQLLILAAGIFGLVHSDSSIRLEVCRGLLCLSAALIVLRRIYPVNRSLYREVNLPYYMTMPFSAGEFVLAKYLQQTGTAYKITGIFLLPIWVVYTIAVRDWAITGAIGLGILLLPQFVLLLLFLFSVLFHCYVRNLLPQKPIRRGVIPAAVLAALAAGLILMSAVTQGRAAVVLLSIIWEHMLLNNPVRLFVQGKQLQSILHLMLINIFGWLMFVPVVSLYRPSILQRHDLDEIVPGAPDFSTVMEVHSRGCALLLREKRMIRDMKAYVFPGVLSSVLLPGGILLAEIGLELLLGRISGAFFGSDRSLTGVLVSYVMPLSILPSWMNLPAATAFSRDAYFMHRLLVLPVERRDLLQAKVEVSLLDCTKGTVPYVLFLAVILIVQRKIPFWGIFPALFLNQLLLRGVVKSQLYHDLRRPSKEWKNYREMMNWKSFYSGRVLPAVLTLLCLILGLLLSISGLHTGILLGVTVGAALLYSLVMHVRLFTVGLYILQDIGKDEEERLPYIQRLKNKLSPQSLKRGLHGENRKEKIRHWKEHWRSRIEYCFCRLRRLKIFIFIKK